MGKKTTITQIAEYLGISPATVSRALNHRSMVGGDTLAKIDAAMEQFGYQPSKPTAIEGDGHNLIVLNVPNIGNIFYQDIIKGARSSAAAHNYEFLISESPLGHSAIQDYCRMLSSIHAAGLILLNHLPEEDLQKIRQVCPVIQCSEYNEESEIPYVSINNYSAARVAAEYLISCGCSKISLINGPRNFHYAAERLRGFMDTMEQNSLSVPKNWIVQLPEVDFQIAYAAVCKILNSDIRPNAFFAVSDIFAAAAIRSAYRYGLRVPQDIMVVGFDNIPISMMTCPSITTISQPTVSQGYAACELLLDMIENPQIHVQSLILETELIVRESTSMKRIS
ncbi:MAG: LacI family transcriptional regulator [Hungatella sp.]|nr:LacI family transcriptional regulator [Hungatella sp.]